MYESFSGQVSKDVSLGVIAVINLVQWVYHLYRYMLSIFRKGTFSIVWFPTANAHVLWFHLCVRHTCRIVVLFMFAFIPSCLAL